MAEKAIGLSEEKRGNLSDASEEVASDVITGVSWFLPNPEEYGLVYFAELCDIIESKARKIIKDNAKNYDVII